MKLLLFLAASTLHASLLFTAPALNYWVDSANGSDANPPGLPYQTIAHLATIDAAHPRPMWNLAAGSNWREEVTVPRNFMTVQSYSTGAKPILDGADVVSGGAWSLTGGTTYQFTATVESATNGAANWPSMWEDGVRMQEAASQGALVAGQYFAAANPSTSTITIYMIATGSGNPASNGKTYEYAHRGSGVTSWAVTNSRILNIHGKRQYQSYGSVTIGQLGRAYGVQGSEGNTHNVFLRGNTEVHDCTADEGYAYNTQSIPIVYFESAASGDTVLIDNCTSRATTVYAGGFVGVLGHGGGTFGPVTYRNVTVTDVVGDTTGNCFQGENSSGVTIINGICQNSHGGIKLGVPATINGFTMSNPGSGAFGVLFNAANLTYSIDSLNFVSASGSSIGVESTFTGDTVNLTNSTITAGNIVLANHNGFTLTSSGNTFQALPGGDIYNLSGTTPALTSNNNNFGDGSGPLVVGATTYTTLALYKAGTSQDLGSTPISYFIDLDTPGSDSNSGLTPTLAWATTAHADTVLLHTGQSAVKKSSGTWSTYRDGPYNPNNFARYSEPLLANLSNNSGTMQQGSVTLQTDNGITLSSGCHFPAVQESDFCYPGVTSSVVTSTQYTLSAYCVRDDLGVFNPGGGNNAQVYFRLNNTTINSGITTTQVGSTALYRISATATIGAPSAANWGLTRSAISVQAAGFSCSGFQVNAGSSPAAYTPTP